MNTPATAAQANLVQAALELCKQHPESVGIAFLQRNLKLGYSAASELMSTLIDQGMILASTDESSDKRYTVVAVQL